MKPSCLHCRFWSPGHTRPLIRPELIDGVLVSEHNYAQCRRHSPQYDRFERAAWPETIASDWCGEFEVVPPL